MRLSFWARPLARDLDIDSPSTTELRREIIAENHFLRRIYQEWYSMIAAELPGGSGAVLEIGSGAGFLAHQIPDALTSDVFAVRGLNLVLNCCHLPLASECLRAIAMTNVFHHISSPALFLDEAARCIRIGGAILMIEPWDSPWSRWVYGNLHHEPYDRDAKKWDFPSSGPLSGANGALPWIVFERDRARLTRDHPQWRVASVKPLMPLAYLVSGGVTYRSLLPAWLFSWVRALEGLLPLHEFAMFACIKLERTAVPLRYQSHSSAVTTSS